MWTAFRYITTTDPKTGERIKVRVDMEFDLDRIAQTLGHKAYRNKSRTSRLAIGIKAEARKATTP